MKEIKNIKDYVYKPSDPKDGDYYYDTDKNTVFTFKMDYWVDIFDNKAEKRKEQKKKLDRIFKK